MSTAHWAILSFRWLNSYSSIREIFCIPPKGWIGLKIVVHDHSERFLKALHPSTGALPKEKTRSHMKMMKDKANGPLHMPITPSSRHVTFWQRKLTWLIFTATITFFETSYYIHRSPPLRRKNFEREGGGLGRRRVRTDLSHAIYFK
jgi:hypothetical protein